MTTKLAVENFIVIELALAKVVASVITSVLKPIWDDLDSHLFNEDYDKAYALVSDLDFAKPFQDKKTGLWFYTVAALNFGAAVVTKDVTNLSIPKKVMEDTLPIVVGNLINNLAAKAKEGALDMTQQLIDEEKASHVVVVKADKANRIVRDFQSFDKGASVRGMVTSQLHTSRLSAFGFTTQAEVLGVTTYAINEQLDNRICPVCKVMHKKQFSVSSARAALDTLLYVQNADEIKGLQAWPKQDKASVETLAGLTDQELTERNWHIPPFHPYCRGLLYTVGDVPDLPVPEDFNYVSTSEDFTALGLQVTEEELASWNVLLGTHPADVLATLGDTTSLDILEKLADGSIFKATGLDYLSIAPDFVKIGMTGLYGGATATELELIVHKDGKASLTSLDTTDPTGFANSIGSLLKGAQGIGINSLTVAAGADTSYYWGLMGFVPTQLDWDVMTAVMASRLTTIATDLPLEVSSYVLGVISSTKVTNLSLIAELSYPVKGVDLGKYLLDGFYWTGTLDTTSVVAKSKALTLLGK